MITVKQRGEGSGQMIIALHFHKGGLAILHQNEIWGISHSTPKSDYVLMDHPDLKFVGTVGTGGPVKFFLAV